MRKSCSYRIAFAGVLLLLALLALSALASAAEGPLEAKDITAKATVTLAGFDTNVLPYYQKADLLLSTSEAEGFDGPGLGGVRNQCFQFSCHCVRIKKFCIFVFVGAKITTNFDIIKFFPLFLRKN